MPKHPSRTFPVAAQADTARGNYHPQCGPINEELIAHCSHLTRLERGMLRLSQGVEMADEIVTYGFATGPITKKDLEPEPIPVVQPIQQDFREAIILILAIAIVLFAATQFLRTLRQLPAV